MNDGSISYHSFSRLILQSVVLLVTPPIQNHLTFSKLVSNGSFSCHLFSRIILLNVVLNRTRQIQNHFNVLKYNSSLVSKIRSR